MAPKTVSVSVKYAVPGTQPPIFLAGSFSDPAWQPQEMQYTTDENNEHEFFKEVNVEQGKEYQYKFRIGLGEWWILNENSPTATDAIGNRNNVLTAPITEDTTNSKPTQDDQEESSTKTKSQDVHDKSLGEKEATPESIEEAMGTRETSDVLFSDEITNDVDVPAVNSLPILDPQEPLEPHPTPAAGLDKSELELGQGLAARNDHIKDIASAEATKPAAVPNPEISLRESPPTPPKEPEPHAEHIEVKSNDATPLQAPIVVVEKVDDEPSYGDDFGPDATVAQKDAHNLRTQDAEPDQTIVRSHTPELADVAAEVADSAETLDRDAPTPPISDEEAGRIGYRRLSNTPIPEVAKTAAEVADTAAVLDGKAIGDLIEERGYFAIMQDESIVFPETPADEKVPLFPHERGVSPKGSKRRRGPVDIPSKLVKLDDPSAYDPNDPSIKPFPEDREGILRHLALMQERLPPDTRDCVGGVNSPIKEEIHCPEKPISPAITFADPSPSLDAITEDDEEQDLPNGAELTTLNGEPKFQDNSVNGVKETAEEHNVEKENNTVRTTSSHGGNGKEPEVGSESHREVPVLASQNITPLLSHSMDRHSFDGGDDEYVKVEQPVKVKDPVNAEDLVKVEEPVKVEEQVKNPVDEAKPAAETKPSADIPVVAVESVEPKLANPIARSASPDAPLAVSPTRIPATPLIVGNRQLGHEEEDVQQITTESGLSIQVQPATPRGSTADPDMGKSTAFEDKNGGTQIKARKKQASPTPDRPLTPSSMQGKEHSKNFLKAIWKVVFVEWIGGLIMRLCNGGRGRQTLLAVGAFAVLASAPAMYRFFLTRLVEFKTRRPMS